jgi:RNA polymerase sigma-70 factor (ECF subfamily)
LQEVLLKLFEKLETFHGECKFSTWLYSVTVNASLAYLRAEKKYRNDLSYEEHIPNIAKVSNEVNIGNWNLHSHDTFLTREIIEKIEQSLNELLTQYRIVFHQRDVEGLTNLEVAAISGLSLPTVKFRIRRARIHLRCKLSDHI